MGIYYRAIVGVGQIVNDLDEAADLLRKTGYINDDNAEQFEDDYYEFVEELPIDVVDLNLYTGEGGVFVGIELDRDTVKDYETVKADLIAKGFDEADYCTAVEVS